MNDMQFDYDFSALADQAMHHIKALSEALEQITASSKIDDSVYAKRAQLADLNKMIKLWETKRLPVPEELRIMQLSLSSELGHAEEVISLIETLRTSLEGLLKEIPSPRVKTRGLRRRRMTGRGRDENQQTTSLSVFREQILQILRDRGGKAPSAFVKKEIKRRIGHLFTERDKEVLGDGQRVSWWNKATFARLQLVKQGLIVKDSPRGIWELT